MSADISTEITMRGKKKELLAFIKVLRVFERDKLTQYQAGEECSYIEFVELDNGMDTVDLDDLTVAEIKEFISECEENEIEVTMEGPYGRFGKLGETGLFEALSEAAPKASFEGSVTGETTGAHVALDASLSDGILFLDESDTALEEWPQSCDFDKQAEFENAASDASEKNMVSYTYDPITRQYHGKE